MAKTVLDVLNDKIDEQVSSAMDFLKSGGAKDYAQYREVFGLIRGLETAKSHSSDLLRNHMMENDDD
jgi:hypothetical protein